MQGERIDPIQKKHQKNAGKQAMNAERFGSVHVTDLLEEKSF